MNTEANTDKRVLELIDEAIASFGNQPHLSAWERGQVDGLLWAKQIINEFLELKNPATA